MSGLPPGRTAYDRFREDAIFRYARMIKNGEADRGTTFGFAMFGRDRVDITAEVLEKAGPETEEQKDKRAAYLDQHIGEDVAIKLLRELEAELDNLSGWELRFGVDSDEFVWDEDAEDQNERVLIRKKDGRKFQIEVDVTVTEIRGD